MTTKFSNVYEAICNRRLYYKKTDGGAEYLCTEPIEGTIVGDLRTAFVRLDGGAELLRDRLTPVEQVRQQWLNG